MLPASVLLYSPSLGGTNNTSVTSTIQWTQESARSGTYLLYIESHPLFQLARYVLTFPFGHICNKNSRIE